MGNKPVADWRRVRGQYVEGRPVNPDGDPTDRVWPTHQELADEWGIRLSAVQRHSKEEGWTRLRQAYQDDLDRQRREAMTAERVRRAVRIDRGGLVAAEAGLQLVNMRLARLAGDQQQLDDARRGTGIPAGELSALALAARRWIDVRDVINGRPGTDPSSPADLDQTVADATLAERIADHYATLQPDEPADPGTVLTLLSSPTTPTSHNT